MKKMLYLHSSVGRNPPSQESILFKSKTEIRQNFKQRTEAINAHSVLYMYNTDKVAVYTHIKMDVGILFLLCSFG